MTTFHSFALPRPLLARIDELGFTEPTDIQRSAVPALLDRRDVVGIAQTGTGKTAAFGLPLLAHLELSRREVQGLVLVPTRELAIQVSEAIADFGVHYGAEVLAVYGGAPYLPQLRALKHGVHVVVGTPGRIMDLMERGALRLDPLKTLILDEADEMLTMGFADDVETIASAANTDRMTGLFSATMPKAIEKIARTHLRDPLRIEVTPPASTVAQISQEYAIVPHKFKLEALERVLSTTEGGVIVFVRTRAGTDEVLSELARSGFNVAAISGAVPQIEREKIVRRLREGSLEVLVATDVAARGLDVERISLVVNLDPPRESEAYVHRIGRTGRAGRAGRALTFFTPREERMLRSIERTTGAPLTEIRIPTRAEVRDFQIRRVLQTLPLEDLSPFRRAVEKMDAAPLEVAAALLARAVGSGAISTPGVTATGRAAGSTTATRASWRLRYEETVDEDGAFLYAVFEHGRTGRGRDSARDARGGGSSARGAAARGASGSAARGSSGTAGPRVTHQVEAAFPHRYRLDVGHRDRIAPGRIVAAITSSTGITGRDIGKIQIHGSFALVDLAVEPSKAELARVSRTKVAGRPLEMSRDYGPGRRNAPSKASRKRK